MSIMLENIFPLYERLEELKHLGYMLINDTLQYAKDTTEHLTIAICIYICLCVVIYFVTVYLRISPDCGQLRTVKRVLFVIAHPDDECMFFGPIIVTLAQRSDCQMFLLCLSNDHCYMCGPPGVHGTTVLNASYLCLGDHEKLGKTRKNELWESCKILGIPDNNITLCKSTYLPDDPTVRWREDIVANLILNHVESLSIDTVITFDKAGVSRHQNHISIFFAAAYLCMERKIPPYCKVYALESINTLRKYSGLLDVPISYLLSSYWYIIALGERDTIQMAMKAHSSQYVWYRRLYMVFSRYTIINTLKEIEIIDLELDLELDD